MTTVIYTPLLASLNKRQYPVTTDQLNSLLAGASVVTFSSLTQALAPYLLISSLGGSLVNYAQLAGNETFTGTIGFGSQVIFSGGFTAAPGHAIIMGGGFTVLPGGWGGFGGPEPWCDVEVFGASSALSDNSAQIQAAISYMNTNFGGGIIQFPHGDFVIKSSIQVLGGCILRGVGRELTTIDARATDTNVLTFEPGCLAGCGIQQLQVFGRQDPSATHSTVVVSQNIAVLFRDCNIWFGAIALNMAGEDGQILNCSIQGYQENVYSTGANWYERCSLDDAICSTAAFFQDMTFPGSISAENHFTDCDFSTNATSSVYIDDGGATAASRAITIFNGCIFSKLVQVVRAQATMISTGEIGSNVTVSTGGGVVILTGNYAFGAITVTGGTAVVKAGNYQIS
jgi:pectate lyase-like protein